MKKLKIAIGFLTVLLSTRLFAEEPTLLIRIFSKYPLEHIEINSPSGTLTVNDKTNHGSLILRAQKNQVLVTSTDGDPAYNTVNITSPENPFTLVPSKPIGNRSYQGSLMVQAQKGHLILINKTPLEDYVAAVLSSEASDITQPEALMAMAIVTRSYALAERFRHKKDGYDLCDLTHCQIYHGASGSVPSRFKSAVEQTRSLVLTYNGQIIPAYYHDCCGGQTENSEDVWKDVVHPYLRSVKDVNSNGKAYCRASRQFRWWSKIKVKDLERIARKNGWIKKGATLKTMKIKKRTPSGRAILIQLSTLHRTVQIQASRFYLAVGRDLGWDVIRSTWFSVEPSTKNPKTVLKFAGCGYGHGVGLCQSGAAGMAKAGIKYPEILHHYFKDVEVTSLDTLTSHH